MAAAHGQAPAERERAAGVVLDTLGRRGDLTLRDATLEGALFTISELWGVNIVAGEVQGSVNGVFKDAPLRDILDSILLSNGYAYRPVGGSLVVSRLQELGQINPFFVSETIAVGSAEVGEVVEAARLMSTPQGQVRALPSAGAILVVDFPDRVAKIRELVRQVDAATRGIGVPGAARTGPRDLEVAYFRTHYVAAEKATAALDVVLSANGRITSVEKDDRLLIVDYPENIRMAEAVLGRVDRPRPQVNIKALIYDIALTDLEQIGVNWDSLTSGVVDTDGTPLSGNGLLTSSVTQSPFDPNGSGSSFTFFSMNNDFNLRAVILALQQAEDSRLLADPNVTVMDNEIANIESIQEIPFQQLTQTGGGGNIGTTSFKEVGIKLQVTPKIARDGTIDLQVDPEFSRLAGFTPADNQPIVDTRKASTRVRIANGRTLMIAGLRQRADVGDFDGVPLLKDVRFFGHLFRSRDTRIEESELVVFITPELVGFSDPLGDRDRRSADTVNCRLDQIPAGEGCPPCGPCADAGPSGSEEVLWEVDPTPSSGRAVVVSAPVIVAEPTPAADDAETLNPPVMAAPLVVEPTPTVSPASPPTASDRETIPPPAEPAAPSDGQSAGPSGPSDAEGRPDESGLEYPPLARRNLRRLPPINAPSAGIAAAGQRSDADAAAAATAEQRPLRVAYDQRFRAEETRVAPTPADPEPARDVESSRRLPNWRFWR
ncbi:MAG: secretin N-terminal domain-containing protein [Planctomycetota bacterium]